MSFKFNPNPVRANFLTKPGIYEVCVTSLKFAYTQAADYYCQITFQTKDGEQVTGMLSTKADKSGAYTRLNDFVAATSIKSEIDELVAAGEVDVTEAFFEKVVRRAQNRYLSVDVRSKTYTKKDGTKGEGVEAVFFARLPAGPDANPF
jgi:hypothetical protein